MQAAQTLVNVCAVRSVSGEARVAHAHEGAWPIGTVCIGCAVAQAQRAFVDVYAVRSIASVARLAAADVASHHVLAIS